jgi:hypothetical protein
LDAVLEADLDAVAVLVERPDRVAEEVLRIVLGRLHFAAVDVISPERQSSPLRKVLQVSAMTTTRVKDLVPGQLWQRRRFSLA